MSIKTKPKVVAVVLAGGSGVRFKTQKQFTKLKLKNLKYLFEVLLSEVDNSGIFNDIILVVPKNIEQNILDYTSRKYPKIHFVYGGSNRLFSIKSAVDFLKKTKTKSDICLFDASRPIFRKETTMKLIEKGQKEKNNIVLGRRVTDAVAMNKGNNIKPLDKDKYIICYSPHFFIQSNLEKVFEQAKLTKEIDFPVLIERAGFKINFLEVFFTDLKITYPEDLEDLHYFLKKNNL